MFFYVYYFFLATCVWFLLSVIVLMNMCPESPGYIDNVEACPRLKSSWDNLSGPDTDGWIWGVTFLLRTLELL